MTTAQHLRRLINAAATVADLDKLDRRTTRHHANGTITDRELIQLDDRLTVRRARLDTADQ